MPNVILGVLGIYLFRKVAREEQVPSQWIGLGPAINRIKIWAKKMK
jgi:hypothetical protein